MFLILLNTELLVPGTKINIQFVYVVYSIVEKFTSSNVVLIVYSPQLLSKRKILTTYIYRYHLTCHHSGAFYSGRIKDFWQVLKEESWGYRISWTLEPHKACTDKKKIKFSSYIRNLEGSGSSHIWLPASSMGKNLCISSYIRKPFLIQYMTLHLIPSEFPYIWGKFCFLFYQCRADPFLDKHK